MIEMNCKLCQMPVGLPLQEFHQIEDGYWCSTCTRDEAHHHVLFGWFFRLLTKYSAPRRGAPHD